MKKKLSTFEIGDSGTVVSVENTSLLPKMTEMGLFEGKNVKVLFKAPFGDPIAIDIEGYVLSLRKKEADLIEVEL